jgi:hypothetical protein
MSVTSNALGLSVLAFFWTVLSYLLFVIFEKVHFIAVIMPDFFFELTRI